MSNNETALRSALKNDDVFVEKNTSTAMKIPILRRIFALYEAEPMDLVFYLKDSESKKTSDANRYEIIRRYWEYALPIIQAQHVHRGTYSNCTPTTSNTESGFFGISGFNISCIANYDNARIGFYLGSSETKKNKEAFDLLYSYKDDIEEEFGIALDWGRADFYKASWMCYSLNGVSITNEADWPRMAKFHAEWSDKICGAVLPSLQSSNSMRLQNIAGVFREWAMAHVGANLNLAKCNRTYTRLTTPGMTAILPDLHDAPSGGNTDNHYFYEIINRNGKEVYIQFAISSKNITDEFRAICDKINEFYPTKVGKEEWLWRIPFETSNIGIPDDLSKDTLFTSLDSCMDEILVFEADLAEKLKA